MSKIIAYHGSKARFNQAGVDHSHGKTSNIGLYLSDSKDIARTYAGRTGYVYEIELSLNNPMVVDFEGVNWDSFDYDGTATSYFILDSEGNELGWYSNLPDAEFAESDFDEPVKIVKDVDPEKTWSTDDIARNAKREGHDSVIIENVIDSADKSVREPSTVYVVFDNDCIVNTRLVSENLSESFIGFVKSLDRGWNKSLIEAIVDGYKVIFESESSNDNFLKWFNGSKVVDTSGNPLIVYHGTSASPFNTFVGKWNVRFEEERGTIYFTDDKDIASGYGSLVYACYLKMLNPLVYDAKGLHWTTVNWYALRDALSGGHDGVILKNVLDTPAGRKERTINTYIVFDASQIKSATENNGMYNSQSNNIFESDVNSNSNIDNIDSPELDKALSQDTFEDRVIAYLEKTGSDVFTVPTDDKLKELLASSMMKYITPDRIERVVKWTTEYEGMSVDELRAQSEQAKKDRRDEYMQMIHSKVDLYKAAEAFIKSKDPSLTVEIPSMNSIIKGILNSYSDEESTSCVLYVYKGNDKYDSIGLLVNPTDKTIEIFEENEESNQATISAVTALTKNPEEYVKVFSSQKTSVIDSIESSQTVPKDMFVSPDLGYAKGYLQEDRDIISFEIQYKYLNPHSQYDWQVNSNAPIRRFRYV